MWWLKKKKSFGWEVTRKRRIFNILKEEFDDSSAIVKAKYIAGETAYGDLLERELGRERFNEAGRGCRD